MEINIGDIMEINIAGEIYTRKPVSLQIYKYKLQMDTQCLLPG